MKTNIIKSVLMTVATVFFIHTSQAQNFDQMAAALRSGNAAQLAGFFQSNVEITIKDSENSYSKSQAEMVLKNFFSSHAPKSFAIAHQGTSPEGSKYFIGALATSTGTYRTYVYCKQVNGAYFIQEIRFEEQ